MSSNTNERSQLLFSILEFLKILHQEKAAAKAEESENLEVALQCLTEAFHLDFNNPEHQKLSLKPDTLETVFHRGLKAQSTEQAPKQDPALADPSVAEKFQAYLKLLEGKGYFGTAAAGTPEYNTKAEKAKEAFLVRHAQSQAAAAQPKPEPTPAELEEAEKLKKIGNDKLTEKNYKEAIEAYSKAIQINPNSAIYYCNRAAAYSFLDDHEKAVVDCTEAIKRDPGYTKAYSRLGTAYFHLGKAEQALEQYRKVLKLDPTNPQIAGYIQQAEALQKSKSGTPVPSTPAPSAAAPPAGGFDLGGLGGLLNNPQFMNMAQQAMQNPQFQQMAQNLMSNPDALNNLGNMANGLGGLGGLGNMANMANLFGGAGGAGGAGGNTGGDAGGAAGNPPSNIQ